MVSKPKVSLKPYDINSLIFHTGKTEEENEMFRVDVIYSKSR
jgi:hypothetical protein